MKNNEIVPNFDVGRDKNLTIRLQKIEDVAGCLVMYLTGYFDVSTSNHFQGQVAKAIEAGFVKLIFHLDQYNMDSALSSSGNEAIDVFIGSFTAFLKAVRPRGGDVVLLDMQPKVHEILKLLGFAQYFNMRENLDEAVAYFANREEDVGNAIFP